MILTNEYAIKVFKALKNQYVRENIVLYPENERDGRDDLQFIADEIGYVISMFEEDGYTIHEELVFARELLRETKNGKEIPLILPSLAPKYRNSDIVFAKQLVAEYKQLKYYANQLNKKGYYSKW